MKMIFSPNHPVFILFSLCSFLAASIDAAPKIECDMPKYDFGKIIGPEQITHEYVLWNRGDEPLAIVKIDDCCGMESTVKPMTVQPGSNAVCTAVFTTKTRYGKQQKQIRLSTNDMKNRYFDLWMTGILLKPVEFTPRFIRLGDLLPDSAVSETITATNLLDEAVTLESVSTTIKGIEAELVYSAHCRTGMAEDVGLRSASLASRPAVEAGRAESVPFLHNNDTHSTRVWTIRITSLEPLVVGEINGQVQLNFSSGTVTVPVVGDVQPIIQAVPDWIRFPAGSTKTVERVVMLRSGDGRPFDILSAELGNADGSVETQKLADGRWQVKVSVRPNSIQPDAGLSVKTTCSLQAVVGIPLITE